MKIIDKHYLKPDDITYEDYDTIDRLSIHELPDIDRCFAFIKFNEAFYVANEIVDKLLERIND